MKAIDFKKVFLFSVVFVIAVFTMTSFAATKYDVVFRATKGLASGGGRYEVGETVTLIATPKPGYVFDKWIVPESIKDPQYSVDGEKQILKFKMFGERLSIQVEFIPDNYKVKVEGEKCTVSGKGRYMIGDTVTLVATSSNPNMYQFEKWEVPSSIKDAVQTMNGKNAVLTFTMPKESVNIKVSFSNIKKYTVTTIGSMHGIVFGGGAYAEGDTVILNAKAEDKGYVFSEWQINRGVLKDAVETYDNNRAYLTFTMPASTVDVKSVFGVGKAVNVEVENGVVLSENRDYVIGKEVNVVVQPNEGFVFDKFEYNDLPNSKVIKRGNTYILQFIMPENDVNIKAKFVEEKANVVQHNVITDDYDKFVTQNGDSFTYYVSPVGGKTEDEYTEVNYDTNIYFELAYIQDEADFVFDYENIAFKIDEQYYLKLGDLNFSPIRWRQYVEERDDGTKYVIVYGSFKFGDIERLENSITIDKGIHSVRLVLAYNKIDGKTVNSYFSTWDSAVNYYKVVDNVEVLQTNVDINADQDDINFMSSKVFNPIVCEFMKELEINEIERNKIQTVEREQANNLAKVLSC